MGKLNQLQKLLPSTHALFEFDLKKDRQTFLFKRKPKLLQSTFFQVSASFDAK